MERGQVLLAHPLLEDENFHRGVILITEHDEEGTVGLMLNDQTTFHWPDALEGTWPKAPLHIGGPVDQDMVFFLHCRPDIIPQARSIDGFLHWGGEFEAMHTALRDGLLAPGHIRFFAGYSGWSPGQLTAEINEGSWAVIPGKSVNCLSPQRELYEALKNQLPPDFRLWSNAPKEPQLN